MQLRFYEHKHYCSLCKYIIYTEIIIILIRRSVAALYIEIYTILLQNFQRKFRALLQKNLPNVTYNIYGDSRLKFNRLSKYKRARTVIIQ